MQSDRLNVHLHARIICALRRHIPWPLRTRNRVRTALSPDPKAGLPDHLADDIGLSESERERMRLQLPSQTTRHPML
ncbi:hypothetical protein [Thalassococcus sp. S3]|uniref:hypothetical protein n=1 Tax=Thalassococcus sp. S3 TaxID=2017482 RepID=UPI0010246C4C|nr:hypothetical protein [Thalassococcus sp. S3]QBF29974.1 hypothetical protein CFI11_01890 [Thalassococcus sp. S3]